jgi:hypothetical protein
VDDAQLGNDARFPALGLDVGHLVVGHSDEGFCFGIKDGIKRAGRNGKILVWQRIIAGFDPSRPSQKSSWKNNRLDSELRRVLTDSMLRHVAKNIPLLTTAPKVHRRLHATWTQHEMGKILTLRV